MASKIKVALEIKSEIIKKIKDEGATVLDLSKQYGISDKTIYGWLRVGVSPGATVMENSRLKREKQQLVQTIGLLTVALEKTKKGIPLGELADQLTQGTMAISKTQLAKDLGVSRSSLYYQPKMPAKDEKLKQQILKTWKDEDPAYGHKRLAPHLKINKKRVNRVCQVPISLDTLSENRIGG